MENQSQWRLDSRNVVEIAHALHKCIHFLKIINATHILSIFCRLVAMFIIYDFLADIPIVIHFHFV